MERIFGFRQNTYAKIMGTIAALGIGGLIVAFFIPDQAARSDLMKDFGGIVFCALVCVLRSHGGSPVVAVSARALIGRLAWAGSLVKLGSNPHFSRSR